MNATMKRSTPLPESDLHAAQKYAESMFFFEKLKSVNEEEDEWYFYYSAFLVAWRSVLDVLLYDAAFFFKLGFTLEDHMKPLHFRWAARRLNNQAALAFLAWWFKKINYLNKLPLWEERDVFIHRGYEYKGIIYVPTTTSSSVAPVTISGGYIVDGALWGIQQDEQITGAHVGINQNTIEECENALAEMKSILNEAIELLK